MHAFVQDWGGLLGLRMIAEQPDWFDRVPIAPDDPAVSANQAAWAVWEQWAEPVLTLWTPGDFVLGHLQPSFVDRIPGAAGQPHQTFEPGGHFLQDERGEDVVAAILAWLS